MAILPLMQVVVHAALGLQASLGQARLSRVISA